MAFGNYSFQQLVDVNAEPVAPAEDVGMDNQAQLDTTTNLQGNYQTAAFGVSTTMQYGMEALDGQVNVPEVTTTVEVNPEIINDADMAGMSLQMCEPKFGGGLLGDIMGAVEGLGDDVKNTLNPESQVVTASFQPEMVAKMSPTFG